MDAVSTEAIALAYYEHLSNGNTAALIELFHADAVFEHPYAPQALHGREQILAFFREQQRMFRRMQIVPTYTFAGYPDWAVAWSARIEKHDGTQFNQSGVDVFLGRNHAIEHARVFYDPTRVDAATPTT